MFFFWPLKLCRPEFAGQGLHCSITPRGKEGGVQNFAGKEQGVKNSVGQICLQSLPRGVMKPFFCAPRSFGPHVLCPTELWSNATYVPQTHRDITLGPKLTTEIIKQIIIFVNHCHFIDLYTNWDHFVRTTYFAGRFL